MSRIVFGKEGKIRPVTVVVVGMVLSTIAFALDWMIVRNASAIFGSLGEVHGSSRRRRGSSCSS